LAGDYLDPDDFNPDKVNEILAGLKSAGCPLGGLLFLLRFHVPPEHGEICNFICTSMQWVMPLVSWIMKLIMIYLLPE
jgi:hypothetical protein